MTSVLRPMSDDDIEAVLAVQEEGAVAGLSHIFPQDDHPFPRDQIRQRWLRELQDPAITCLVVQEAGHVVGFAAVRGEQFLHFGTVPHMWGSGLAGIAHDDVLERCRLAGLGRVRLRVFQENLRARRFYERRGWLPTGRETRTAFPPNPVLWEYELHL